MRTSSPIASQDRPLQSGWERLPGEGEHFVRTDWRKSFHAAGLRSAEDFFVVQGDELSKPGLGERYRARLVLKESGRQRVVYLKRFGHEPWLTRWRRWYEDGRRISAGEREMRRAEALLKDDLPVAVPVAWGCRNSSPGQPESFVVLEGVPGMPVHHWWKQAREQARPDLWVRECQLVHEIAELVARFHQLGWRHRDLYLAHLFVAEPAHGRFGLWLIDLQRVFRPSWRTARWRIKDLSQLDFSASSKGVSRTHRLRFARDYARINRLEGREWIQAVLRKSAGIRRRESV